MTAQSQPRAAGEAAHPARSQLLSHSHVYMMDGINSHGERCTAVYSRLEIERACSSHAELLADNARLRGALGALAEGWSKRGDEAEKSGNTAADEKNWGDARVNMAKAVAYAKCAADLREALRNEVRK